MSSVTRTRTFPFLSWMRVLSHVGSSDQQLEPKNPSNFSSEMAPNRADDLSPQKFAEQKRSYLPTSQQVAVKCDSNDPMRIVDHASSTDSSSNDAEVSKPLCDDEPYSESPSKSTPKYTNLQISTEDSPSDEEPHMAYAPTLVMCCIQPKGAALPFQALLSPPPNRHPVRQKAV
jgi:hypothetical protein